MEKKIKRMSKNEIENIDLALEIMLSKFKDLMGAGNSLDQKIGYLVGFVAVILSGIVMFFGIAFLGINFFTMGVLIIFISLIILILISKTQEYKYPPHVDTVYSTKALRRKNIDLKNQIIADIKKSFEDNYKIHQKKAEKLDLSLFLLIIGIVLIFAGLLVDSYLIQQIL